MPPRIAPEQAEDMAQEARDDAASHAAERENPL